MDKNNPNKKAHIVRGSIGIFAFDDNENLIMYKFYDSPKDFFSESLKIDGYTLSEDDYAKKIYRKKFRDLCRMKFVSDEDVNEYLTFFGIEFSKSKMNISKDLILVQAVRTYEDLQKEINVMVEHFYEWFVPYYPEFKEDPMKALKLFLEFKHREKFPGFKGSVGMELSKEDFDILYDYALNIDGFIRFLNRLEKYIKKLTVEIAPNMSNIVGPLVAARLISKAGSLEKIASMSSSTIQLLGAEKALFRFLKSKKRTRPPKYGIIYFSPYIQKAPKAMHGKVARIISSKLSIAAKVDYYSGTVNDELKRSFEKEMKSVMK